MLPFRENKIEILLVKMLIRDIIDAKKEINRIKRKEQKIQIELYKNNELFDKELKKMTRKKMILVRRINFKDRLLETIRRKRRKI